MCVLLSSALFSASAAIRSFDKYKNAALPGEIYSDFLSQKDKAEYFLKSSGGYVTVFSDDSFKKPLEITPIETGVLRKADRAMLEEGIPVRDRTQLLRLLEDLGS